MLYDLGDFCMKLCPLFELRSHLGMTSLKRAFITSRAFSVRAGKPQCTLSKCKLGPGAVGVLAWLDLCEVYLQVPKGMVPIVCTPGRGLGLDLHYFVRIYCT